MAAKAIGYVSDIVLGQSGEVISRQAQKDRLRRHAAENGIELLEIFEDEIYDEDVVTRPGIQRLLAYESEYDFVLVERVWSLSRNWQSLVVFLKELKRRGRKVESAACLWDCVSQQARHYFRPGYKPLGGAVCEAPALESAQPATVRRPERLNFVYLKRRAEPA
ncbi:MAG: recombinase family protein [Acidobacteria bacterium]|nr:recombinase family protein [Acidobacteriota bacterium]